MSCVNNFAPHSGCAPDKLGWRKPPVSISLREGKKGLIEIPFSWIIGGDTDMHVSMISRFFGLGFRCYDRALCKKGMELKGSWSLDNILGERPFHHVPVGKDYLEWRLYFFNKDTPASEVTEYYRLLHFPKAFCRDRQPYDALRASIKDELSRLQCEGIIEAVSPTPLFLCMKRMIRRDFMSMASNYVPEYRSSHSAHRGSGVSSVAGIDKHIVNMSTDLAESGEQMTYSIDVTWTEKLADYLFIFPTLRSPGIKCEWSEQCVDYFVFRKWKTFDNSLDARLFFKTHGTADLNNYAVFLTDEDQMDFRIYRFSSRPADPPSDSTVTTPFSTNSATVLLAVVAGVCLLAFVTLLTVYIMRSRKVHFRREIDQQAATETSERRHSDGYEVLPGERISGDYEHIVEERGLSDDYESMLNEDFPRNNLCDRNVSSSSHYQTISLENLETSPRGASALSQKNEALLKVSKSCGDLASGKADTFEHADNRKTSTEQEPKPFCSTFGRQNNEEEEQPRLQWFMLRDSTDGDSFAGAFYSIEAEQCMELQDFSTRGRCSADADGECEYLTALDSSREHEDYLELIAD
ncbi:hypothetical protein PoB_004412000 [Plakobranchus ocellatus]|uniref:CUB domain-containing protein n=1 Tax=Plakobranchus ocellatus TaxID=259542 RepID=A0AAV4BDI8_9GAST|nr:hypothetical protein PoB_004412000 [Plakobranchus ocellatus]